MTTDGTEAMVTACEIHQFPEVSVNTNLDEAFFPRGCNSNWRSERDSSFLKGREKVKYRLTQIILKSTRQSVDK